MQNKKLILNFVLLSLLIVAVKAGAAGIDPSLIIQSEQVRQWQLESHEQQRQQEILKSQSPNSISSDNMAVSSEKVIRKKNNRLLEILFPVFYSDTPMDPESLKYLDRELNLQKFQQDMQNNSNHQMEKMLRDTAPRNRK